MSQTTLKLDKPLSTRESLLLEAKHLLETRGFDSFSFQDLADKVGIRKASVHSHFKDKEELGITLVEKYLSDFQAWAEYTSKKEPWDQLQSMSRMLKRVYTPGVGLCANGAFLGDWGVLASGIQKKMLELQEVQVSWIAKQIEAARKAGHLKFEGTPRARAEHLFVTIVGAMQAARAWKRPETFDVIFNQAMSDLGLK